LKQLAIGSWRDAKISFCRRRAREQAVGPHVVAPMEILKAIRLKAQILHDSTAMQLWDQLRTWANPQARNPKLCGKRKCLWGSERGMTELEPNLLPTTFDPSLGEETLLEQMREATQAQPNSQIQPHTGRTWQGSRKRYRRCRCQCQHQFLSSTSTISRRSNSRATSTSNLQRFEGEDST